MAPLKEFNPRQKVFPIRQAARFQNQGDSFPLKDSKILNLLQNK